MWIQIKKLKLFLLLSTLFRIFISLATFKQVVTFLFCSIATISPCVWILVEIQWNYVFIIKPSMQWQQQWFFMMHVSHWPRCTEQKCVFALYPNYRILEYLSATWLEWINALACWLVTVIQGNHKFIHIVCYTMDLAAVATLRILRTR